MEKLIQFAVIFMVSMLVPTQSHAHCFNEASAPYAKFNVTPRLLYALAKRESNFRVDAINLNKDGTRDIGVMQINSRWLPVLSSMGITEKALMSDTCLSESVGAWILAQCFVKYGVPDTNDTLKYWSSVGAYNAGYGKNPKNHKNRMIYANAIYKNMLAMK